MISRLKLNNFRRFENTSLDFNNNIIILHGNNAKGKSTVLEAIYLLTNGKSPWAHYEDIYHNTQEKNSHFRIEGDIKIDGEKKSYAIFKEDSKKQHSIDSHNTTSRKFFEHLSCTIFSPDQIELLMISPSKRRGYIDDLISKVDYSYASTLSNFTKSLRQRNAYLKKLAKVFYETGKVNIEDQQLKYWTNEFVKYSSVVITKRSKIIEELGNKEFRLKYSSSLKLNLFEDLLDISELSKAHLKVLENNARRDVAMGHTQAGAHRDDWSIHNGQDIKRFGSRGQKRIAIGKLIFQAQELIAKKNGTFPTLLLDDISSELDEENTALILSKDMLNRQQTFITTIDLKHIPKEIQKIAQVIDLNDIV